MIRKSILVLGLLLSLSLAPFTKFSTVETEAADSGPIHNLNTGLSYASIQEAIDAAETLNGHTILIEDGMYSENPVVSKALRIVGEDKYTTTIDGSLLGSVFLVTANNVEISNLTIQNPGPWSEGSCIELKDVSGCYILDNIVRNPTQDTHVLGISIADSSSLNYVSNNIMKGTNLQGISFGGLTEFNTFSGNTLINSSIHVSGYRNEILDNTFNDFEGTYVVYATGESNSISYNNISKAAYGILVDNGLHIKVSNNTMKVIEQGYFAVLQGFSGECIVANNTVEDALAGICSYFGVNDLVGNSVKNTTYGILTARSINRIMNNILTNNTYGLHLGTDDSPCGYANVSNNIIYDNEYGVYLNQGGRYNNITKNTLFDNDYGIFLSDAYENTIDHNSLDSNSFGIHCVTGPYTSWNQFNVIYGNDVKNGGYGIYLSKASNTTARNNFLYHNLHSGIYMTESYFNAIHSNILTENNDAVHIDNCHDNNFTDNTVINNNGDGFRLERSPNNIFHNNSLDSNHGYGMELLDSSGNTISHNFFNNNNQVFSLESTNSWDNGYPLGGNCWNNHRNPDLYWGVYQNMMGSDGIVDVPYVVDASNQDNYPLMSPYTYWRDPIPGDINRDMKVDSQDLHQFALAYGSTSEKPNWNPSADLNKDDLVDCKDLLILGASFGRENLL